MTETAKYRVKRGRVHMVPGPDGELRRCERGDVFELTATQARELSDIFEPVALTTMPRSHYDVMDQRLAKLAREMERNP
jgi:hypothetical protein